MCSLDCTQLEESSTHTGTILGLFYRHEHVHWSENSGRNHREVKGRWKRPCGYVVTELQRTGGDLPGRERFTSNKGQRGWGGAHIPSKWYQRAHRVMCVETGER